MDLKSVETYKVYFYFGLWKPNPFVKPSKVVEVEVFDWETENDIVAEALNLIGSYPKTYSTTVIRVK